MKKSSQRKAFWRTDHELSLEGLKMERGDGRLKEHEGAWSRSRWRGQDSVDTEASPNSSRLGDGFGARKRVSWLKAQSLFQT